MTDQDLRPASHPIPQSDGSPDRLRQGLRHRHLGMIALGGMIGAGLFVGSGTVIRQVGPGAFLSYAATGIHQQETVKVSRRAGRLRPALTKVLECGAPKLLEQKHDLSGEGPQMAYALIVDSGPAIFTFYVEEPQKAIAKAQCIINDVPHAKITITDAEGRSYRLDELEAAFREEDLAMPVSATLKLERSEDNPSASIDKVIEAVRQILIQSFSLRDLIPKTNISPIIRQTIFYYYEGGEPGKWLVSRPHSASARAIRENTKGRFPPKDHPMRYDHAIPLAVLQPGLRLATASQAEMRSFLQRNVQGVVLTKHENDLLDDAGLTSIMPPVASSYDLMARYKAVGIHFNAEDEAALTRPSGANG